MVWIFIFGTIGLILLGIWLYLQITSYKRGSGDIAEYVNDSPKRYNPDINRFAKNTAIKSSAKNAEFASYLALEMQSLVAMMRTQTEAIVEEFNQKVVSVRSGMQLEKEVVEHKQFLATHERDMALVENEKLLISEANRLGLPVSAMNELKLEEARLKMRLFEQEQTTRMELTAADFLELTPYQQVELLNERLENLRRKRYDLFLGNDPPEVKDPLLKRYDKNIRMLEKDIDARQKRLLQAQNG
jgi:hypothetical protein